MARKRHRPSGYSWGGRRCRRDHGEDKLDDCRAVYRGGARLRVVLIGAAAFGLYVVLGVPAIYVLLGAALVGAFLPVPKS